MDITLAIACYTAFLKVSRTWTLHWHRLAVFPTSSKCMSLWCCDNSGHSAGAVDWMFLPPESICWSPRPRRDGLWVRVIRPWWWGPHDGISAFVRKDSQELARSLSLPCGHPGRGCPLTRQGEWPQNETHLAAPWSWTSRLQNCDNFLSFKPPSLWYLVVVARADR